MLDVAGVHWQRVVGDSFGPPLREQHVSSFVAQFHNITHAERGDIKPIEPRCELTREANPNHGPPEVQCLAEIHPHPSDVVGEDTKPYNWLVGQVGSKFRAGTLEASQELETVFCKN